MASTKTVSPMCKTELLFTSQELILVRPLALLFKAGDSQAHVNHVRGLELVQPQELRQFFFSITVHVYF